MLELKNIVKDYQTGDETVHALKGINLAFRKHEFVAILGHSGCGKTTMLNIIGGLDRYTSGDLIINGRSTKEFKDRDWDSYRNHSIGFVFQSYNLIPHQSVLSNVELALTLTGVSRTERRKRAIEVLKQVGLADQIHKKPNQMSGGQMQRVAIARALINDPDILLADEPTGALDSETSVQLMELLKSISKDKLIIMVTHNPELAENYANRTIRIVDGSVVEDSSPYETVNENQTKAPLIEKKPSMSLWTAFTLSLNNLMTKKTRTILTSFAGSIGIIGIALILSLSNGIQSYIDLVQEETLSSYPLTIESETVSMEDTVANMMGNKAESSGEKHDKDKVYFSTVMYDLMNTMTSVEMNQNNLKSFKNFLENDEDIKKYASSIQYTYGKDFDIYTKDVDNKIVKTDVMTLLEDVMSGMYGGDYSSYFSTFGSAYESFNVWQELITDSETGNLSDMYEKQYDLVYGKWPENHDELVLVMDKNNEISDLVMYALGLRSSSDLTDMFDSAMNMEQVESTTENGFAYEDICAIDLKLILPSEYYQEDTVTGTYKNLTESDTGLDYLYGNNEIGIPLKIVGIVRVNEDSTIKTTGAICYTPALTDYVVEKTENQELIKKQLADTSTDILSGLPFKDPEAAELSTEEKKNAVIEYTKEFTSSDKAALYSYIMSVPEEAKVDAIVEQQMEGMERSDIEALVENSYVSEMGVDADTVKNYIAEMDDETLFDNVKKSMKEQISSQMSEQAKAQLASLNETALAYAYDTASFADWQYEEIYDNYMPSQYSESSYEDNLDLIGYMDSETPTSINIYASSFENKDMIADAISRYNEGVDEDDEIDYTDYVAILMSSITTIINAISYVLIAFVAISLIVSSIMIGIITYISVLERTKEIGILRSIGASKKDISRVFNAETIIVGLVSGLFGIGITLLLILPINYIIHKLTDIYTINAILPTAGAVILIIISMLLTFIAGLIPAKIAAKKDPVEALRTE